MRRSRRLGRDLTARTVVEGEGLRDILHTATRPLQALPYVGKRIKFAIDGPRKVPTKRFNHFLDTVGTQPITSIAIARKPIEGAVSTALNVLSLGKFNRAKQKLGYDHAYHNYLLITTADGKTWMVNKNHVIEEREATAADLRNEHYDIPLPTDRTLTIRSMFDTALNSDQGKPASEESKRNFVQYDGSSYNCQRFTQQMVEDNGLQPADPKALELLRPQDAKSLMGSLGLLAPVAKVITDTAAVADRVVWGDGVRRKHGRGIVVKSIR